MKSKIYSAIAFIIMIAIAAGLSFLASLAGAIGAIVMNTFAMLVFFGIVIVLCLAVFMASYLIIIGDF